jgi:hypothetical protein
MTLPLTLPSVCASLSTKGAFAHVLVKAGLDLLSGPVALAQGLRH